MSAPTAPTLELLDWLSRKPRTYAETMEAWQSHCPRFSVWEDALADGYVRCDSGFVVMTDSGKTAFDARLA